jgi:hypothetical protein
MKIEGNIAEAMDLVQEECSEIIQIISKIRRFGFDSHHPDDPLKTSNQQLLEQEIADLEVLINYLADKGIVSNSGIEEKMLNKIAKLKHYTTLYL